MHRSFQEGVRGVDPGQFKSFLAFSDHGDLQPATNHTSIHCKIIMQIYTN